MQKEEYAFVTVDGDDEGVWTDAVTVDLDAVVAEMGDHAGILPDVVFIDENYEGDYADFITLDDGTALLSEADMVDLSSDDWNTGGEDIIVIV
jgi:hypothetical protein